MEALKLLCSFSLITNKLRYCGPKEAYKEYANLFENKPSNIEKIKEDFRKYEGLYVYLEYMAEKLDKDPFDYDIVEAYWLGNELLDQFDDNDNKEVIRRLVKRGLPKTHADSLIKSMPPGMNLSHSFNVLFVGVGKTTGSVPTNLRTMNKCIISMADVKKVLPGHLEVSGRQLNSKLEYGEPNIQKIKYNISPKIGDIVAVHWDYACKILTKQESANLMKYTQKNLDALTP